MTMRMNELVKRSGLPRTTIHHYLREDLLPPARKTAPNAAVYDDRHLERLRLVTRLRGEEFDELSVPEIRSVLALVDEGIDVRTAVRLVREGVDRLKDEWTDVAGFARSADVPRAFLEDLMDADLVGPEPGDLRAEDIVVVRACAEVCASTGLEAADLAPLGSLIREVGNYSRTLVAVERARGEEAPEGTESAPTAAELEASLAALCSALTWRAFSA